MQFLRLMQAAVTESVFRVWLGSRFIDSRASTDEKGEFSNICFVGPNDALRAIFRCRFAVHHYRLCVRLPKHPKHHALTPVEESGVSKSPPPCPGAVTL